MGFNALSQEMQRKQCHKRDRTPRVMLAARSIAAVHTDVAIVAPFDRVRRAK